jgi:hypothetical protein
MTHNIPVVLIDNATGKLHNYSDTIDELVEFIYYQKVSMPDSTKFKALLKKSSLSLSNDVIKYIGNNVDKYITDIKLHLSSSTTKIPLYDVSSENMYIITRDNVYNRVFNHNYRFPDESMIKTFHMRLNDLNKNKHKVTESGKSYVDIYRVAFTKRKIRKLGLMIKFLNSFDIKQLYKTYTQIIYEYTDKIGKNIITCQRPSYLPHLYHIPPYYSRDEIINIGLNMGIIQPDNTYYDKDKLDILCTKVSANDISSDIILNHQMYIANLSSIGMFQYYTLQGSYFMNQYLRDLVPYNTRNRNLEKSIQRVWETINNSPSFDKDYVLYRFIHNDKHLRHLNIGDTFVYPSFMSTTRNSLYNPTEYQFGFMLLKINIPKNTPGVALCLESISCFPSEQEIILSPLSLLKLESRDNNIPYYHPNSKHADKITTRYEFTYVGKLDIKMPTRKDPIDKMLTIDFMDLTNHRSYSIEEKIKLFVKEYTNEMYQFVVELDNKPFVVVGEWYNGISTYSDFYSVNTQHGFILYSIWNGIIIFMIELGETDKGRYMHVNFYERYYVSIKEKPYSDKAFIEFISKVGHYFDIDKIILYSEHLMCNFMEDMTDNNNNDITDKDIMIFQGGNYSVDFYNYIKNGSKRYNAFDPTVIKPAFDYYQLNRLYKTNPNKILKKSDNDELYQIYDNTYLPYIKSEKNTIADFYVFIIINQCHLLRTLTKKMRRLFKKNNPFEEDYYIINPSAYLYNNGFIDELLDQENMEVNHNIIMYTPKNEYRISDNVKREIKR